MVGEPIATPPTPAADPTPKPSSVTDAIKAKDFESYRTARHAERVSGTNSVIADDNPAAPSAAEPKGTAPAVEAETNKDAAPSAAAVPKPRVEARASENRVPELLADRSRLETENARLRADLAARPSAPTSDAKPAASSAVAPTDDPEPDPTDATKYPDGMFDRKFVQDQARWGARQELQQHEQARQTREKAETFAKQQVARVGSFHALMVKAGDGDPQKFYASISEDVRNLKPMALLGPDETPTARHAIAEEILSSDHAAAFMTHFTDHPEDLARISQLTTPVDVLREMSKLEARLSATTEQPKPEPKTITKMPDAGIVLGRRPADTADPVEAALKRKDFPAYQAAKRRALVASLRGQ